MRIRIFYIELVKEGLHVFPCIAKLVGNLSDPKSYNFRIDKDNLTDRIALQLDKEQRSFDAAFRRREFERDRFINEGFSTHEVQVMTFTDDHDEVIKYSWLRMDSFQHMMETRFDLDKKQVEQMFKCWQIPQQAKAQMTVRKSPLWGII